ncbi:MAG TPA: hypothetical protein DCG19_11055, partial [Cryomorphaceae bacterium]|nr:hypothetical protein [Cryomorphaceae bacterium]
MILKDTFKLTGKIFLGLAFLLAGLGTAKAQLSVGDILITGYASDDPDQFAFMATTAIAGGTEIRFTDNGWQASGSFRTGEGEIVYTVGAGGLSAGDQVAILIDNGPSVSSGGGSVVAGSGGNMSLSSGGDQIIIFTGSLAAPTLIGGFHNNSGAWEADATSSSTSALPTGLTNGTSAWAFPTEVDNCIYGCSVTSGTKAALQAAVNDENNWNQDNDLTFHINYTLPCSPSAVTWDGATWSNVIGPDATTDAIISSSTSPGTFTCQNLEISNGFALTINSGNTATIAGNLTNSGSGLAGDGTIAFDNDGNSLSLSGNAMDFEGIISVEGTTTLNTNGLITLTASSTSSYGQLTGTGTISGNLAIEAYIEPGVGGRYYYLGSPMSNATLNDFNEAGSIMVSENSAQGTAWEWDAANSEWDPAGTAGGSGLASTATRGRGYALYVGTNGIYGPFLRSGDGTITLTGSSNNDATVNQALSYNDGQASSVGFVTGTGINDTEGWNLVANPYAAIYDWDLQSIPADMSSAIYRFNGVNYTAYVKGAGSASRYIAPFQGFFVQMTQNTPSTLVFNRDNRTTSQAATLAKTANYTVDGVSLHIEGMNGDVYDDVFVGFDANSTIAFDNNWDARKLRNKGITPDFYVAMGQSTYSVCRVPYTGPWSFPMKLDYDQDGDLMTISAD